MSKGMAPEQKKQPLKEANRGTQDELEILAMLVLQNLNMKNIVMDRLRAAKSRHLTREEVKASRTQTDKD